MRTHTKQEILLRVSEYSGMPKGKLIKIPKVALEFAYFPPDASIIKGFNDFSSCPTANLAPTDQMSEIDAGGLKTHLKRCMKDKDYLYMQVLHIKLALEQQKANDDTEKLRMKLGEKYAKKLAEESIGKELIRSIQKVGFISAKASDGRIYFITLEGIYDRKWNHICTVIEDMEIKYDRLLANYVTILFNMHEIVHKYENMQAPFWEVEQPQHSEFESLLAEINR